MTPTKYPRYYVEEETLYRKEKDGNFVKQCIYVDNVGYYQTVLFVNGKRKYVRVHRILAETLIPNPNGYKMVNHKDGNKLNNKLENLEWCTNSYNTQEAYNNGLYPPTRSCPIKCTDLSNNVETIYKSIRNAAESLKMNRKSITAYLKGFKTNPNYKFEYV